ncbi:MAG: hypothetical protein WDA53_06380 [Bacillota bacterium]
MYKLPHKFKYFYGFILLTTIFATAFLVNLTGNTTAFSGGGASSDLAGGDYDEIRGKGLEAPVGKNTIGAIIAAFELDKEEFFTAIGLPLDFPETETMVDTITKHKMTTYKKVNGYLKPIKAKYDQIRKETAAE